METRHSVYRNQHKDCIFEFKCNVYSRRNASSGADVREQPRRTWPGSTPSRSRIVRRTRRVPAKIRKNATLPTISSRVSSLFQEAHDHEAEKRLTKLRHAQHQLKKCLADEDYAGAAAAQEHIAALKEDFLAVDIKADLWEY